MSVRHTVKNYLLFRNTVWEFYLETNTKQAYLVDCCRTRPFDMQKLCAKFYEREHTKPLFHKNGILTYKNLYNYHVYMYA